MKMTERIGPNLSGRNHRGLRYTPKPVIRRGFDTGSAGYVPLSQQDVVEMVKEFRAKYGRDPKTLHHSGLGGTGTERHYVLSREPYESIWLKLECNGREDYLE